MSETTFDAQKNIDTMAEELEKTFSNESIIPTEEDLKSKGIKVNNPYQNVMSTTNPPQDLTRENDNNHKISQIEDVPLGIDVIQTENEMELKNSDGTELLYDESLKSIKAKSNQSDNINEQNVTTGNATNIAKKITTPIDANNLKATISTKGNKPLKESDAIEYAKTQVPTKPHSINPEDFLKNLTVDLNNIDVVDENPLNKFKNFNFIMNRKSKTQVIALQSGYLAYVEGYNYDDINALVNSSLDDYGNQLLLCQTVFNSINNSSIGQVSFDKWCELTSYYDLDSFLYGNYLETFPGDTTFTVKCGTCGKEIEVKVNNDTLITARNGETKELVNDILATENNSATTVKNSILNTSKKIFLPDSKVVITYKLPSIKKHLNLLASINAKAKDKNQHVLTFLLFIEDLLMLDLESSLNAGSPKYNRIIDNSERTRIIKHFTYNDAKLLSDSINELINKYQVNFSIKSFTCSACGNTTGDVPVDMESLLFFRMSQ